MAFRSTSCWKWMVNGLRGRGNATYATSTTPKLKAYAPASTTADYAQQQLHHQHQQGGKGKGKGKGKGVVKGDFVPVYVAIAMIMLSVTLGLHTATQQLVYSPTVRVNKKRRETLPEVVEPERVVDEAVKLITKSFFRKVAHVQEFDKQQVIPHPIHKDAFAYRPRAETLKSVGVDPNPN